MANTIVWFDLPVANLERATVFYSKLLGKELKINTEHGFKMTILPHEDHDVSGCLFESENFKPNTTDFMVYFNVDKRIKDAVSHVVPCGGKVLQDVEAIGPWGYRAILLDSEGNKIAIHSSGI